MGCCKIPGEPNNLKVFLRALDLPQLERVGAEINSNGDILSEFSSSSLPDIPREWQLLGNHVIPVFAM